MKLWKDMTGKEATVEMIHAGLECGILQDSIGKMDMISIGPDMDGVHAPGKTYRSHRPIGSSITLLNF